MHRSREEILRTLETNRDRILAFGVRRLGLFGSYARNEAAEGSDMDFVVEFGKKSFDGYMDLKTFLEELFGCRVDLVIADAVKPLLWAAIVDGAVHAQGL